MRKPRLFPSGVIVLAAICSVTPIWAQDYSFEEVLRKTLLNSSEIQRKRIAFEVATLDVTRMRSAFLPRLDLNVDNSQVELLGNLPGVESLQLAGQKTAYVANSSLKLSLNLYNGGQDLARWDKAEEKLRESDLQWRRQRAETALKVLERHHAFALSQIDWQIAQARATRASRKTGEMREAVQIGRESPFRLAEAELDEQDRQLDLLRRQRERQNAWSDLMEISQSRSVDAARPKAEHEYDEIPEQIAPTTDYLSALPSVDLATGTVVKEVDIYRSRELSAQFEKRRTRGRYEPIVDFYVKHDLVGLDRSSYDGALQKLYDDKRFIGVTLRWNLFEGFDAWAEVRQADKNAEASRVEVEQIQQDLERAVRDRVRMLANAESELIMERQRLEIATRRLKLERLRMEVGRTDTSTLEQVETDYKIQQAEVLRREQVISYLRARSALSGDMLEKLS